jgi:hypothetical protein
MLIPRQRLHCRQGSYILADRNKMGADRPTIIRQLDRPFKSPIDRGCDRWGWGMPLFRLNCLVSEQFYNLSYPVNCREIIGIECGAELHPQQLN